MKKINLVTILAILSILSIMSVSATTTLVTPAASSTVCLNNAVNISTGAHGGVDFNCTLYAKSSLTANSSWGTIKYEIVNTSANNAYLAAVNFSGIEDANNYILNATCKNITGVLEVGDTNTGIIADCTVPTAPSSLSPTSDTDGTVDFSATVTGKETTSCILYFVSTNPGATSYTMTHSGNTCTYLSLSMPEQSYQYYVTASDETNTTDSSTTTLDVDIKTSAGKTAIIKQAEKEGKVKITGAKTFTIIDKNGFNSAILGIPLWLIALLVVCILIIYFAIKKK